MGGGRVWGRVGEGGGYGGRVGEGLSVCTVGEVCA
jgi:hypothetical protein